MTREPRVLGAVGHQRVQRVLNAKRMGMSNIGCWMSDVNSRMSDPGWRISDVVCRMSDVGCRISNLGCQMSDVQSRMSDLGCRMATISFLSIKYGTKYTKNMANL